MTLASSALPIHVRHPTPISHRHRSHRRPTSRTSCPLQSSRPRDHRNPRLSLVAHLRSAQRLLSASYLLPTALHPRCLRRTRYLSLAPWLPSLHMERLKPLPSVLAATLGSSLSPAPAPASAPTTASSVGNSNGLTSGSTSSQIAPRRFDRSTWWQKAVAESCNPLIPGATWAHEILIALRAWMLKQIEKLLLENNVKRKQGCPLSRFSQRPDCSTSARVVYRSTGSEANTRGADPLRVVPSRAVASARGDIG